MARQRADSRTRAHLEWLGFVQPQGLVVSTPALNEAGAVLNRNDVEGQRLLRDCCDDNGPSGPEIRDFREFAKSVLGWTFHQKFYRGDGHRELPDDLVVPLPEFHDVLKPDYAIRHRRDLAAGESEWQLLIRTVRPSQGFDSAESGRGTLDATAHGRLERLLRATGVQAGVLYNGRAIRLVSAPRGESSGWLDFRVSDMLETQGRPIVAAMRLLLSQARLLTVPENARLSALLQASRQFQNVVSERLAEQVLHALYELVRGLQAAHDQSGGRLLREPLERAPDEVYRGLLTVILRMVFVLYAEQRGLLSDDEVFERFYSLGGLYDRLQEDATHHPTTMDFRYGAWAQLMVLFRMVHDGARSGTMRLPARQGSLFDPGRFLFLSQAPEMPGHLSEGRSIAPLVPDGTVYRVLENLLLLDGERISYRALDVEQIGSVYETMMGFRIETASGISLAIKAPKKTGAPSTINLEAALEASPAGRRKWIQDRTGRKITPLVNRAVRAARSIDELHAALDSVIDKDATPDRVPRGAMVLQPGRDRRASGSHYTPRSLTEPIVRRTVGPVLERLTDGGTLTPEAVLALKVCDPAMGSGAFLVEACRQLGDALLEAWQKHGGGVQGVTDDDAIVFARRVVAQRCLYGVDRNPVAVELAKMSLWLATLAKDHPLTFLDHSLRHGDSLLGLGRTQIEQFHWAGSTKIVQTGIEAQEAIRKVERVAQLRREIRSVAPDTAHEKSLRLWVDAKRELASVLLMGDLLVGSFFEGDRPKEREKVRQRYARRLLEGSLDSVSNPLDRYRFDEWPLASFHWELEFPEVFDRERPGFDAIVGNPPFAGKNAVTNGNRPGYLLWLKALHDGSHGNADVAAHFFRRAFSKLREGGNLGLVATNTIGQGDTRSTGLRQICNTGGVIYDATPRMRWPGQAAVVVSVVHIAKRAGLKGSATQMKVPIPACRLDGWDVDSISAFLVPGTMHDDPARLPENDGKSFIGSVVLGMGFTFDDKDKKGVASTLSEMRALLEANPANKDVIQHYIGGAELNTGPTHAHHRHVINFRDYPLDRDPGLQPGWLDVCSRARALQMGLGSDGWGRTCESASSCRELLNHLRAGKNRATASKGPMSKAARDLGPLVTTVQGWLRIGKAPEDYPHPVAADWPELLEIVRARVRPARVNLKGKKRRAYWWQFARASLALQKAIRGLRRVLAISAVGQHAAFAFLPTGAVYAHSLVLFPLDSFAAFCALQSRPHEIWARRFGSSMKSDLRYTPSDCFKTFPFPFQWHSRLALEKAGKEYYEFRASLMVQNAEGLTKTYNRFHDSYNRDADIEQLRELHDQMDRAVLAAYGWTDLAPECDFQPVQDGKKFRYQWSDRTQEEVLGRLLDLNARGPEGSPSTSSHPTSRPRARSAERPGVPGASGSPLASQPIGPLFSEVKRA